MLYFDYSANTPVDLEVLDCFYKVSADYIGNPNSSHALGRAAKKRMDEVTDHIADLLHVKASEIIYTSGASEANNLAIKGLVQAYKTNGKHIISTCLEHPSVSGALTYLQKIGYEIDLVDITKDGLVDIEHMKELLREDTVLVSICYVDSELGVKQEIEKIGELLKNYPNCYFHVDATQAVGKVAIDFGHIDCVTLTAHKFYGLNGTGILIKKENVVLEPLIHGGTSTSLYRSGTPTLALAASMEKALELALGKMEERYQYVNQLNKELREALLKFPKVRINSTSYSIPHILNVSVQGVKAHVFLEALEEEGICISTKSACSVQNSPSRPVYAVSRDKKNAMCSWRISLSHLTRVEELEQFLAGFSLCYDRLVNKINPT